MAWADPAPPTLLIVRTELAAVAVDFADGRDTAEEVAAEGPVVTAVPFLALGAILPPPII